MKKIAISLVLALVAVFAASAQKFALVDMEYIFRSVPSYEMANEQLNQLSQRWQKEVEAKGKEAENMYNSYLADKVFLTDEQVKKREADIVAKEKKLQNCDTNILDPKANCTRSDSLFSSRYRTKCTTLSRKWPRNAAIRPCSTELRRPTLYMPRHVST